MIYLWTIPENYKNKDIGLYDHDLSSDNFLLMDGRKLSSEEFNLIPVVHFEVPKARILKFDCLPNDGSKALINLRVKNMLEEIAPNDIQFFKAKLICKDGEIDNYYFLNATHLITGIDHEKSVYSKMDGEDLILHIKYLIYQPGCMKDHKIARDAECQSHLLVSEKIKNIFDKERITGVRLVRPEDYYNGSIF